MDNKTDFVKDIDFNAKTSESTITTNPQNQFGRINTGPYLPIQSGTYNIDVISTSDFNTTEMKGRL
jgi:hypothetical protein